MEKAVLDAVSWVLRGSQRQKVILVMSTIPVTPTLVSKKADISLNNASDILRSFEEIKIAKCVNADERTGRLYVLTSFGEKISKELRKTLQ